MKKKEINKLNKENALNNIARLKTLIERKNA